MSKSANIQIHDCIFQFYLEHRVHGMCTGKVHNDLLNSPIGSLVPDREQRDKALHLIKDIPDYLHFETQMPAGMKSLRLPQYYGYLIKLEAHTGIDGFLRGQLSKRNLKNFRAKEKKLKSLGLVEYKILMGPLQERVYKEAFETFQGLLKRRFDKKKILNRYLMDWQALYDQAYPRLVEGKALMFLIQLDGKPIGMALDYILESSVFSHIQTFDQDYSNFNMGDLLLCFQLEWCLDNGKSILDLSKGENAYKEKWCNHRYRLYHELIYPKNSLSLALRAHALALKYTTIQNLRDIGLLGNLIKVDQWLYKRHKPGLNNPIKAHGSL